MPGSRLIQGQIVGTILPRQRTVPLRASTRLKLVKSLTLSSSIENNSFINSMFSPSIHPSRHLHTEPL